MGGFGTATVSYSTQPCTLAADIIWLGCLVALFVGAI